MIKDNEVSLLTIKKALWLVLGFIGLGLGAVGAVMPLLPAFPFLLLAGMSFAKSSSRLHEWFLNTKMYKENLESFLKGRGMTKKAKLRVSVTLTLTMGIGFYMMRRVPLGQIILGIVWVCHLLYFIYGIRTMGEE
jgi:uncharacterized membrane protein YbaN (DUF454 family)